MARIKTIPYSEAAGRLKEIYDDLIGKRGKLAEIHQIQSLRPESIVKHMELYMEIMFSRSELSRARREMIAVAVSVANGCHYCRAHHEMALRHYVKDDEKIQAVIDYQKFSELSDQDAALCYFARRLTLNPQSHQEHDFTQPLKNAGFSDAAILDVVLVVAYFNFVNRIALSLNPDISEEEIAGYNY
jgi:uncharacterized peroxidase-related enzyme